MGDDLLMLPEAAVAAADVETVPGEMVVVVAGKR